MTLAEMPYKAFCRGGEGQDIGKMILSIRPLWLALRGILIFRPLHVAQVSEGGKDFLLLGIASPPTPTHPPLYGNRLPIVRKVLPSPPQGGTQVPQGDLPQAPQGKVR